MSLLQKLRGHFANDHVTWTTTVEGHVGSWSQDGASRVLMLVPRALTAADVVDAHLAGHGARVLLAHDGAATDVARRTARRLGVDLLDAAALPDPAQPPAPEAPTPDAAPTPAPVDVPALEALPLLPPVVEAVSAPEPTPDLPTEVDPYEGLPWTGPAADDSTQAYELTAADHAAMPWHVSHVTAIEAPEPEYEMLPSSPRTPARVLQHPTAVRGPADWGLPWPKKTAPMDALSRADPRIWKQKERIEALQNSMAATGAPSFGAIPPPTKGTPQASTEWLTRMRIERG